MAKIRSWLAAPATAPESGPLPTADGANDPDDRAAAEQVSADNPSFVATGRRQNGPSPAYRLNQDQRDRLALALEHDPASIRAVTSRSLAEKAAAGQSLDPAVIVRLVEVVDRPQGKRAAE